jgi:small nuclear ribonucleoprotein G
MPQAQPELKKASILVSSSRNNDPNLKQYLDKRLFVQLNGSRKVIGVLRGYDVRTFPASALCPLPYTEWSLTGWIQVFLNIVLDDAVEEKANGDKVRIGMVVRSTLHL